MDHARDSEAEREQDVDPEVSIKRIMSRGETVQAHENVEKLSKLRKAYHMVCNILEKNSMLSINYMLLKPFKGFYGRRYSNSVDALSITLYIR